MANANFDWNLVLSHVDDPTQFDFYRTDLSSVKTSGRNLLAQYFCSTSQVEEGTVLYILKSTSIDVNQTDMWSWPVLFYAAHNPSTTYETYRMLVEDFKADINHLDNWKRNFLVHYFYRIQRRDSRVVVMLLRNGFRYVKMKEV